MLSAVTVQLEENRLFIWQGRILYAGVDGYTSEPHAHYAASLLLGLDEPLLLHIDGQTTRPRAVLLAPNLYHQSVSQSRVIVIQIDPDSEMFEPASRWLGESTHREVSYDVVASSFVERWNELYTDGLDCTAADCLYRDVLIALWGRWPDRAPLDPRIAGLIEELKQELPDQVSAAELAARVGLSEDRFMHVFKAEMGLPVRRYLLWLRLHRAARMMTTAGVNLTDAAHAAGFSDSAHMSRTFKENFGVRPSEFLAPGRRRVQITVCADS